MGVLVLNGARCSAASLTIPMYGAWSADASLATDAGPASGGKCEFAIGTLEMNGTARRAAAFAGGRRVRIVAGGGGWRKVLPPRSYSHDAGVRKASVLEDAARESGEQVKVAADRVLGRSWVRDRGKAERVLRRLSGGVWYVDNAGVTQVRDRDTSQITSPFTVVSWDGARGRFEIATEAYQDWVPGRTFVSPTVPDAQTVSLVSLTADNNGKIRLVVLTADSERERMLADVRAIIRSEMGEAVYSGLWEYVVAGATDKTIDGTPTDPRMPAIRGCPILPGTTGHKVVVKPGTKAIVAFVNQDPALPVCVFVRGGALEHLMTVEACVLMFHNVFSALGQMNGIFLGPVIAATVAPAITAALGAASIPIPATGDPLADRIAQELASPALAGSMVAGVPGNTIGPPLPYEPAIAALAAKPANVSGHFPGIGLPAREDD